MGKKHTHTHTLKCCCRLFQHRSPTDFVSNRELFKCCGEFSFQFLVQNGLLLCQQRSLQYSFARFFFIFFVSHVRNSVLTESTISSVAVKRSSNHSDTIIPSHTLVANRDPPRTSTCRKCTSSRKQPSLIKQHPLQEQRRLRVGSQTVIGSYELQL